MDKKQTFVALLRGINVGGHHKVPMAELRAAMKNMGFEGAITLLNSGNIIFDAEPQSEAHLEDKIAAELEMTFGFSIPILIRKAEEILDLIKANPFSEIEVTKDIRLYVTFLKEQPDNSLALSSASEDKSFQIIDIGDKTICSVLDLSRNKTTKAMGVLEQTYGKNITTRNWKTLNRIADKLTA